MTIIKTVSLQATFYLKKKSSNGYVKIGSGSRSWTYSCTGSSLLQRVSWSIQLSSSNASSPHHPHPKSQKRKKRNNDRISLPLFCTHQPKLNLIFPLFSNRIALLWRREIWRILLGKFFLLKFCDCREKIKRLKEILSFHCNISSSQRDTEDRLVRVNLLVLFCNVHFVWSRKPSRCLFLSLLLSILFMTEGVRNYRK